MEVEQVIPQNLIAFARELCRVAKKHQIDDMHVRFNCGVMRRDLSWPSSICVTWEQGRHGAADDKMHVSTELTLNTKIVDPLGVKVRTAEPIDEAKNMFFLFPDAARAITFSKRAKDYLDDKFSPFKAEQVGCMVRFECDLCTINQFRLDMQKVSQTLNGDVVGVSRWREELSRTTWEN